MNFNRKIKNNLFNNMIEKVQFKPIKQNNILVQETPKNKYFWENETEPTIWVSMIIPSYNTKKEYLISCINSIKEQVGNFGLEIIWINDCSTDTNTEILVNLLETIIKPLKNCKLVYIKMDINNGISSCLHNGVNLSSNEIIFRMDSDDIMKNNRIEKQLDFIMSNPLCVMCGTNMTSFEEINGIKNIIKNSTHKNCLTWEEYKKNPIDWFLNHPTLCFKKTAILNIGNYRKNFKLPFEDLDLELRVLKKYGAVYNINECLIFYRVHNNQVTKNTCSNKIKIIKKLLIQKMISS
jgi:glycosyltransferase involved in cell wall biosynthesis